MAVDGRILSDLQLKELDQVKKGIRCLLIAEAKEEVTPRRLNELYEEFFGTDIPIQNFYFSSLIEFLARLPDVCQLKTNKQNIMCVQFVESAKTKHITDMKKFEKTKNNHKKQSVARRVKEYNLNHAVISPSLFCTILSKLRGPNCLPKIKKDDVLIEVVKNLGHYAFYNIESLHNQLNDLTHLLRYDNEFIYFKNSTPPARSTSDKKSNVSIKETTNNVHIEQENIVKEHTQKSLRELIKKHRAIKTWKLPSLYRKEFQKDLDWQMYGFHNIIEFCNSLSHILQLIQTPDGNQTFVTDAENPIEIPLEEERLASPETQNVEPAVPLKVISKQRYVTLLNLTPKNAVRIDESIHQVSVQILKEKIPVIVTNIINPSYFWIQLISNSYILDRLISDLEDFYPTAKPGTFQLPEVFLRPGVWVACKFSSVWCRGLITEGNLEKSEAKVFLIDYGTVNFYPAKLLCFLDKRFMNIPAQAIPCSLHNVEPLQLSEKWNLEVVERFRRKVGGKSCVAHINSVDIENNSMEIFLLEGTSNTNINKWLTINNMARYGIYNAKIRNPVIEQRKHCKTKSTNLNLSSELVYEKSQEKCALEVSNSLLSETSFSSLASSDSSDLKQLSDSQSTADLEKTTSSYKSCNNFTNPVMQKFIAALKKKRQNKKNSLESTISDASSESSKSDVFQSCASSTNSFCENTNPEDIIIESASSTHLEFRKKQIKRIPTRIDMLKEPRNL